MARYAPLPFLESTTITYLFVGERTLFSAPRCHLTARCEGALHSEGAAPSRRRDVFVGLKTPRSWTVPIALMSITPVFQCSDVLLTPPLFVLGSFLNPYELFYLFNALTISTFFSRRT